MSGVSKPAIMPQHGGLAGARRAEHGEELAVADVEVDVVDSSDVAELAADAAQADSGRARPSAAVPVALTRRSPPGHPIHSRWPVWHVPRAVCDLAVIERYRESHEYARSAPSTSSGSTPCSTTRSWPSASTVRRYCDDRIRPHIADWFESGEIPARELAKELGALGLLGHASARATAARARPPRRTASPVWSSRRPTPGSAAWSRSRARWRCSPSTGSAATSRRTSGCPGWPPARRSAASVSPRPTSAPNPGGMRTRASARRLGLGAQRYEDVDHQRVGRRRRDRVGAHRRRHPRLRRPDRHAPVSPLPRSPGRCRCAPRSRASSSSRTSGFPASAMLPEATRSERSAECLSEARFGIVFGSLGAARDCLDVTLDVRAHPAGVRQAARGLPAHPAEAGRHDRASWARHAARPTPRSAEGHGRACAPSRSASAS